MNPFLRGLRLAGHTEKLAFSADAFEGIMASAEQPVQALSDIVNWKRKTAAKTASHHVE
jgi:hypothetical protein